MLDNFKTDDLSELDKKHPGPWYFGQYGQNGFDLVDATGALIERGKDSYDAEEDNQREAMIASVNAYVAETLGAMTDKDQLAQEFFRRRKHLTSKCPVMKPKDAKMVAGAYAAINKPHIAEAISGVRYGRKLLTQMREYRVEQTASQGYAFTDFSAAMTEGYFSPEEVGTTMEELHDLYKFRNQQDVHELIDSIREGSLPNEDLFYMQLSSMMYLADVEFSSLDTEDQELLKDKFSLYREQSNSELLIGSKSFLEGLRNGGEKSEWRRLKWYMVAGNLTAADLSLEEEEIQRLEGVLV